MLIANLLTSFAFNKKQNLEKVRTFARIDDRQLTKSSRHSFKKKEILVTRNTSKQSVDARNLATFQTKFRIQNFRINSVPFSQLSEIKLMHLNLKRIGIRNSPYLDLHYVMTLRHFSCSKTCNMKYHLLQVVYSCIHKFITATEEINIFSIYFHRSLTMSISLNRFCKQKNSDALYSSRWDQLYQQEDRGCELLDSGCHEIGIYIHLDEPSWPSVINAPNQLFRIQPSTKTSITLASMKFT